MNTTENNGVKIELRSWRPEDLAMLVKLANDESIAANLTNSFPHPYTETHGQQFIHRAASESPTRLFCISVNDEVAGAIGLHPQSDIFLENAELGYWLGKNFRGRGVMTEAVKMAVEKGFSHFPHIKRIFARPFGSNMGSRRVLEKAGFKMEAVLKGTILKNGKTEDEYIFGIRRS